MRKQIWKMVYEIILLISEMIEDHYSVKKAATKQAYRAQAGRRRKAAMRHKELFSSIMAEAKSLNRALSTGIQFAHAVRPGVLNRLGLEPEGDGWPTASTIKGAITKLKARKT
ncbi:MAG: hypothetical protein JO137_16635 [Hyphomicrobiales bacterium]|nr:hypothetical protein [Hyphomicrobiales bacterium]